MALTTVLPADAAQRTPVLHGRRYDHFFFAAMALLMSFTVFVGFAKTYFLAGVFQAPLPSFIIHLHGAVFTAWMVLLITQTCLVSAGRVDIHRRLGIAGFFLACLMVVLGVLAATDSLVREAGPAGRDVKFFYIIPLSQIVIFVTLVFFAFRNRSNSPAHKRLIIVATVALMTAAIARWPFMLVHRKAPVAELVSYIFLLLIVAYDLWSLRRIHPATLWGGLFLVFVQRISLPIGKTALWHTFATWVQHIAR